MKTLLITLVVCLISIIAQAQTLSVDNRVKEIAGQVSAEVLSNLGIIDNKNERTTEGSTAWLITMTLDEYITSDLIRTHFSLFDITHDNVEMLEAWNKDAENTTRAMYVMKDDDTYVMISPMFKGEKLMLIVARITNPN